MNREEDKLTNREIRNRVTRALVDDSRTEGAPIEVVAEQGVVTLRGQVPNRQVREAAEEITKAQEGVVQVVNDLAMEPPEEKDSLHVDPLVLEQKRPPIKPQ
jgi:osmotically-inducible protein OsmY